MKISNILWGLVLIVIGVVMALNLAVDANINIFFDGWWTLLIIIPNFIDLFDDSDRVGNTIGLLIGVCLLLACWDIVSFDMIWRISFPIVIVVIGFSLILKALLNLRFISKTRKLKRSPGGMSEYYATFSGKKVEFSEELVEGCILNAAFGSVTCDLRNAKLAKEVFINVSSVFGNVTIIAPSNAVIKMSSTSLFGGVGDRRRVKNMDADITTTVYLNVTCMFGGVEVK